MTLSALDRFHAKTKPADDGTGCILWTGCKQPKGYGKFGVKYVTVLAHRWIYEQTHGVTLGRNEWVLHSCDRPSCVNLAHLRAGTPKDNHADMDARGRRVKGAPKGVDTGAAKLTEAIVREARSRRISNGDTYQSLADEYGVAVNAMWMAVTGKSWTHVDARAAVTRGAR